MIETSEARRVRAAREQVATACAVLVASGHGGAPSGGIVVRDPDHDDVLATPAGVAFEEVRAEDLVRVPSAGGDRDRVPWNGAAVAAAFLRARADLTALVHTHALHATAFSITGRALRALSHEGCHLVPPAPSCLRRAGVAELTAALERQRACLLRGHGLVAVGEQLGEAVALAVYLERSCQLDLLAGAEAYGASDGAVRDKRAGQRKRPAMSWRYLARTQGRRG